MDTTNENSLQEAVSYADALQKLPAKDVNRHAVWQLSSFTNHAMALLNATDELKRRGQKLSPKLEGLLMMLRMMGLGDTRKSLLVMPGSLDLQSHFEELSGNKPYQAPVKQQPSKLELTPKPEVQPKRTQEKVIDLTSRFGQPRKPKE